jgi:RNA polymerase primary sigma factor
MKSIKIGKNLAISKITTRSLCLNNYMREVSDVKVFENANEEYECAFKAFNGDEKAKAELIKKNLRFVISVAKQYESQNAPLEDLINEGNFGLVESANKFDPTKGFKFISYAVWYIRKNITEYLKSKSKLIRIPGNRLNELSTIKKQVNSIEQENSRGVHANDIRDRLTDLDMDTINLLMSIDNINVKSISTPIYDNEDSSLEDVLINTNIKATDSLAEEENVKLIINNLLDTLKPKQRKIISLCFGLNGEDVLKLNEIGELLGMTGEGVRQMRNRVIRILKINSRKQGINVDMFNM